MSLSGNAANHLCQPQPLLLVVMGVSGTGKTTLASEFARRHGFTFLDADSLHSDQSIVQMSQGIPLTEAQRAPWIQRIQNQLCKNHAHNKNCILAYSGLKQQHRKVIFGAYPRRAGVLLDADRRLILQRMQARPGHFMSPTLLDSQIADMEPFTTDEPLLQLDSADSSESLLTQLQCFVNQLS
jgi:gluconokinase